MPLLLLILASIPIMMQDMNRGRRRDGIKIYEAILTLLTIVQCRCKRSDITDVVLSVTSILAIADT